MKHDKNSPIPPTSVPGETRLWAVRQIGQNYPSPDFKPTMFRDVAEKAVRPGVDELVEVIFRVPAPQ